MSDAAMRERQTWLSLYKLPPPSLLLWGCMFCQRVSLWQFCLIIPGTDTCWSSLHDLGRNYKQPFPKWGKGMLTQVTVVVP